MAVDDGPYSVVDAIVLDVGPFEGVLANDSDPDGQSLTAVLATDATYGTVSLNSDGSFTYTPTVDYIGWDQFTYFAFDGIVESLLATVLVARNRIYLVTGEYSSETHTEPVYTEIDPASVTNRWVGELVLLETRVEGPMPPTIQSGTWTVPGSYIEYYDTAIDGRYGRVDYHEAEDYTRNFMQFYWHEATPPNTVLNVTLALVLADGTIVDKSAKYEVSAPLVSVLAQIDQVGVRWIPDIPGLTRYGLGDHVLGILGVEMDATIVDAPPGILAWVQILNWTQRVYFPTSPTELYVDPAIGPGEYTLSAYGLDLQLPTEWGNRFTDTPSTVLPQTGAGDGGWVDFSVDFNTYLMWKSERAFSIMAPIRRVDWGFSFHAFSIPNENPAVVSPWTWGPPKDPSAYVSGGNIATDYPEWESIHDMSRKKLQPLG